MKRFTWLESLASGIEGAHVADRAAREELAVLDDQLFEAWHLGGNIFIAWTEDAAERRFLAIRHYGILEPFGRGGTAQQGHAAADRFINELLAGPKRVSPAEFDRLSAMVGRGARVVRATVRPGIVLAPELVDGLVTRYGVTLVRERAVILLDAVGFSLHPPLEQVAMLNSLSYSVNSAYRQLVSEDIRINFARSSTGDGYYIWNRAKSVDANMALYKLLMLILADNAVARRKARRFPVPRLRAAFHVGEHYEFYQVEALNPTTFSYIVGHVTIELARMLEKALPGQILLGDFTIGLADPGTGSDTRVDTRAFMARTAAALDELTGLAVANDRVGDIRCYLTGRKSPTGDYDVARYHVRDKHGLSRPVYNAKINIHLERSEPIYLGFQHRDLHPPDSAAPLWMEAE